MKKLFGLLMVLAIAMPASAELLKNFEVKGDIQVIAADTHRNLNDLFVHGTSVRVLAGGSFDIAENARVNLLAQYVDLWGSGPNSGNADIPGTIGKSAQDYFDDVRLVEANLEMKELFGWLDAKVGRQFYGDENSTVIYFGPRYYNAEVNPFSSLLATSIDAVSATYSNDMVDVNVVAGEVASTFSADNKNAMYGADIKGKVTDVLGVQAYAYNFKSILNEENFGFYGAKATFAPETFLVSAEYARNMAGDRMFKEMHDNPYMIKADAKMFLDAFTPRATFFYSKNFLSFGNYRPGLLVGDVFNNAVGAITGTPGEGLRLFNIGVDYKMDKWTFALDGYSFQDRTAKHSASLEADLTVKYDYNDNIQLFAGAGYIKYNPSMKTQFDANDNVKGQAGVLLKL